MNQFPSQGQTGSASNVPANPLGTLPINQLLARFAIPSIIAMLVSALYNIVDQFFIGRSVGMLGNAATNAAQLTLIFPWAMANGKMLPVMREMLFLCCFLQD